MTTTNTKTIKSSGGDYTSLSNWEAGRQADLVAGDLIEIADCYDLGAADSTAVTIDGWTTGAANYIRVKAASGNQHAGIRSTSKYRLEASGNFVSILIINEEYTRIEGLQLKNTNANSDGALRVTVSATSDVRIIDCIAYDTPSNAYIVRQGTVTLINCAAFNITVGIGTGDGFLASNAGTTVMTCYNCVAFNCGGNGFDVTDFRTLIGKNCYAGGSTGNDYNKSASGTMTLTTCYSEDGTRSTSTAAFSTSSGGYFTNVTATTEDAHIGASSTLKDAGTSLTGWVHPNGDVDVDGDARTGTWDVGYDEYVSAGGSTAHNLTLLGVGG